MGQLTAAEIARYREQGWVGHSSGCRPNAWTPCAMRWTT